MRLWKCVLCDCGKNLRGVGCELRRAVSDQFLRRIKGQHHIRSHSDPTTLCPTLSLKTWTHSFGNLTALGVDVAHICEDLKKKRAQAMAAPAPRPSWTGQLSLERNQDQIISDTQGKKSPSAELVSDIVAKQGNRSLRSEVVQLQRAINTAVCRHDRYDQCRQFRQSVGVRVLALPDPVDADVGNLQYQASQWLCWPRTWPKEWRPRRLRELALTTTAGLRAAAKRMRTCHPSRKINMV